MIKWLLAALLVLPSAAWAQNQGQIVPSGHFTPGHTVRCQNSTCTVVVDGGGSAGSSVNGQGYLTEVGVTNTGTPFCINDALTSAPGGYHQFCLGANALGGGLISYNAIGGASPLGLTINLNGANYSFPGPGNGNVVGPTSPLPTAGDVVLWNGGTTVVDGGLAAPHVITLAALQASLTVSYPKGVWRDDYSAGLGAPPLWFLPETGTCAANSRVNDGGSCVNTSSGDGNSFYAVAPENGLDLRQFGVAFNNSTDNTTALTAALAWAGAGRTLRCPDAASPALFSTPVSVSITNGKRLSFIGNGHDACALEYTGVGAALTFSISSQQSSAILRGFSLLTNQAGGATAITLTQTLTSFTDGFASSRSLVDDVIIRGADGYTQTDYFTTGIKVNGWSFLTFQGGGIFGPNPSHGGPVSNTKGYNIQAPNGGVSGFIGIVYNFHDVNVTYYDVGLDQGNWTQGIVVDGGSNFDGLNYGIFVDVPSQGGAQLTVKDSQFNVYLRALWGQPTSLIFEGNVIFMQTDTAPAALELFEPFNGCVIAHNYIAVTAPSTAGSGIIFSVGPPLSPCQIHDNTFENATSGGSLFAVDYAVATGNDASYYANNSYFNHSGSAVAPAITSGMTFISDARQTFAQLTPCTGTLDLLSRTAFLSDSTTNVWGANVTVGGGGDAVRVQCNGSNWTVMGK